VLSSGESNGKPRTKNVVELESDVFGDGMVLVQVVFSLI